jgi:predicted Zn-dependent protease with MMP-like domain
VATAPALQAAREQHRGITAVTLAPASAVAPKARAVSRLALSYAPRMASDPTRARRVRRLRDRRGRGLRGRLTPPEVPLSRTRADQFDDVVREAVAHLDERWSAELAEVEFVVDEVPPPEPPPDGDDDGDQINLESEPEQVRLSRLMPASGSGRNTRPPQIVLYRRPLELRALDQDDLAELVLDVLIHEVADLLGVGPEVIDPEGHGDSDYDD